MVLAYNTIQCCAMQCSTLIYVSDVILHIPLFDFFKGVKHFDFIPESYIIPEEFNEFHGKQYI